MKIRWLAAGLVSVTLFWFALGYVGLVPSPTFAAGCLVLSVVFFMLALPLSVLVRLDLLPERLGLEAGEFSTALCLLVCLLNLYLWGLLAAVRLKRRRKNP